MAQSQLAAHLLALKGDGGKPSMEDDSIDNGVEIHYLDADNNYQVDTITGDDTTDLLKKFMGALNDKLDDDDVTVKYVAAADADGGAGDTGDDDGDGDSGDDTDDDGD